MNIRPDGTPFATELTPPIQEWLCKGGLDPNELMVLGFPLSGLLFLWNHRAARRKQCDQATPSQEP